MSVRLDDKLTRVYEPGTAVGSAVLEAVSARDLLFRMRGTEPFRAVELLDGYPHLWESRDDVVLLAAEEYARRRLAGEAVAVETFAAEFRQWREAVRREVEIERRVAELDLAGTQEENRWPATGSRFLHYEIVRLIGRGGFSRVYLARNLNLGGRVVVLKVCGQEAADEAHTLGSLQHPNIGDVLSVDVEPTRALTAICMPFCSLATLSDLVAATERHCEQHGRMPHRSAFLLEAVRAAHEKVGVACPADTAHLLPGQRWIGARSFVDGVLEIGRQLANALAFTHQRNLLHRDIKPSNVLVTASGRAILFDFNLSSDSGRITNVAGTFAYMAPEALKVVARRTRLSNTGYDARSDLYSLGATLYELLSGRHPFDRTPPHLSHQAAAELLLEKQSKGPRPLHEVNSAIDRDVSRVIGRLLAFDPAERYQSAQELIDALNELLRPTTKMRRFWQTRPTLRLAVGGVSIVAPLLVAGAFTVWNAGSSDRTLSRAAAVHAEYEESGAVVSPSPTVETAAVAEPMSTNEGHPIAVPVAARIDNDPVGREAPAAAAERIAPVETLTVSAVPAAVQLTSHSEAIGGVSDSPRSASGRIGAPTAEPDGAAKLPVPESAGAASGSAAAERRKPSKAVVALASSTSEGAATTDGAAAEGKSADAHTERAEPEADQTGGGRDGHSAEQTPEAGPREVAIRITDGSGGTTLVPNARKPQPNPGEFPKRGNLRPAEGNGSPVAGKDARPVAPRPPRQRVDKPQMRLSKLIPDAERIDLLRGLDEQGRGTRNAETAQAGHDASRRVYLMALTASKKDDYERAIALGEETLLKGYDTQALRNNIGYCYWKLGDLDEALAHFRFATEKKGKNRDAEQTAWINWAIAETDVALRDGRSVDLVRFGKLGLVADGPMVHVLRAKAYACVARKSFRSPKLMKGGFFAAGSLARKAVDDGAPSAAIKELAELFPEMLESTEFQHALRMASVALRKGELRPVRLVPVEEPGR